MSKRPSNFRKSDIKRGVQALEMAGHKVARVEVEAGKIILIIDNGDTDKTSAESEAGIVL